MNRTFLLIGIFMLGKLTAGAQGVNFIIDQKWEDIKAEAQTSNKFIFIDCYTEWCSWCKVMDKDRKSTRLNSSHVSESRMPSSA